MSYLVGDEDTICALSTPEGQGGIGVIRVSGEKSLEHVKKLCSFLPSAPESHRVYFGVLNSVGDGSPLDEVLVTYFQKGKSYTGEQTIEISCHGSSYLALAILQNLISTGCRMARKGEFTYRAFMNGRIDLVQAEGVLELINSNSKLSANAALNHLRGSLSHLYRQMEDDILYVCSHLEANIDFTHEDIKVENPEILVEKLLKVKTVSTNLLESYKVGKKLKDGCRVFVTGAPNVGKSSLVNKLAKEEKAIVTPVPGTTRDLVEASVNLGALSFSLVDSAGLRESGDLVERLGIEKAIKAISEADRLLVVVDLSHDLSGQLALFKGYLNKEIIFVGNKFDLVKNDFSKELFVAKIQSIMDQVIDSRNVFLISLVEDNGVEDLEKRLQEWASENESATGTIVTQSRHIELLQQTYDSVERSIRNIEQRFSPELIVFELKDAVRSIHDLLGISVDDRVMDRVFREFCIGK